MGRKELNKIYTVLGASNHALGERQIEDYYATDPKAIDVLLSVESFSKNIWECACGEGHLSRRLESYGYSVRSTDLVYRGYGNPDSVDFLQFSSTFDGDIITNPPYKYSLDFCKKAIDVVSEGHKVAMFLKVQFLEGKSRKEFFMKYPPKVIYVFSSRVKCAKNGEFDKYPSSAIAYAWFIWQKGFKGDTVVKWIN